MVERWVTLLDVFTLIAVLDVLDILVATHYLDAVNLSTSFTLPSPLRSRRTLSILCYFLILLSLIVVVACPCVLLLLVMSSTPSMSATTSTSYSALLLQKKTMVLHCYSLSYRPCCLCQRSSPTSAPVIGVVLVVVLSVWSQGNNWLLHTFVYYKMLRIKKNYQSKPCRI